MNTPGKRFLPVDEKNEKVLKLKQIKSYWFKTFSHKSTSKACLAFTQLYLLFYKSNLTFAVPSLNCKVSPKGRKPET